MTKFHPEYGRMKGERYKLYQELTAISMLAGEPKPLVCSCCLGAGGERGVFGTRRCGQCGGYGYDILGPAAERYMKERFGV